MTNEAATTLLMLNAGNRHYGIDIEQVVRITEFDDKQEVEELGTRRAADRSTTFPYVDLRTTPAVVLRGRTKRSFLVILKSGLMPWGLVVDDAWGSLCYDPSFFADAVPPVDGPVDQGVRLKKVVVKDNPIEAEFYLIMPASHAVQ